MSYRKKEGRYARMIAFWGVFLLFGYGCFHAGGLVEQLNAWMGDSNPTFIERFPILGTLRLSTCIALGVWALTGFGVHLILNRKRIADTLIDTEAEMIKVTWPTWRETWHGTIAVAVMVAVLLMFLVAADIGLVWVMRTLTGAGGAA